MSTHFIKIENLTLKITSSWYQCTFWTLNKGYIRITSIFILQIVSDWTNVWHSIILCQQMLFVSPKWLRSQASYVNLPWSHFFMVILKSNHKFMVQFVNRRKIFCRKLRIVRSKNLFNQRKVKSQSQGSIGTHYITV